MHELAPRGAKPAQPRVGPRLHRKELQRVSIESSTAFHLGFISLVYTSCSTDFDTAAIALLRCDALSRSASVSPRGPRVYESLMTKGPQRRCSPSPPLTIRIDSPSMLFRAVWSRLRCFHYRKGYYPLFRPASWDQ